jgi:hypothetical protein
VLSGFIINHDHVTRLAIADPDCGAAAIKGCCRDWGAGRDTSGDECMNSYFRVWHNLSRHCPAITMQLRSC